MSGAQPSARTDTPTRHWGWHRLAPDWAEALVREARLGADDLVLDLGAGDGALTDPLLRTGARVLAVELHPGRAERLRLRYAHLARHGPGSVAVVERDLTTLRWPARPFHVVANPPWFGAVDLLRRLTGPSSALLTARLVLPAGVVQQAEQRGRGVGSGFRASAGDRVPAHAFAPAPPGRAAVLVLRRTRSAGRRGRRG